MHKMQVEFRPHFSWKKKVHLTDREIWYFSSINLFNHLLLKIKSLSNEVKSFKPAVERFLNLHSFYSVEENFEYSCN